MKRVPLRKRGASKLSRLEDEADTLLQKAVCAGGGCAICGSRVGLGGHHVIPRSRCHGKLYLLRYAPRNMVRLCWKCHERADTHKAEFDAWFTKHRSEDALWLDDRDTGESNTSSSMRTGEHLREIIETLRGCAGQS